MPHRKWAPRLGQACPAALSMAKSDDLANAGATQQSPTQLAQSASSTRSPTQPTLSDALVGLAPGGRPETAEAPARLLRGFATFTADCGRDARAAAAAHRD